MTVAQETKITPDMPIGDVVKNYPETIKVFLQHGLMCVGCAVARFENIKDGKVFKRDKVVKWKCRNCGYIHEGPEAPEKCPACDHEQKYYELLAENY